MSNKLSEDCEIVLSTIIDEVNSGTKSANAITRLRRDFYHQDQFDKDKFNRIVDELIRQKYLKMEKLPSYIDWQTKKSVAQGSIEVLTYQGEHYFEVVRQKEGVQTVFNRLCGTKRKLMLDLLEHKSGLNQYVITLYEQADTDQETRLNELFGSLKDSELITVMWADGRAYHVSLTVDGGDYLELEQEMCAPQSVSSHTPQIVNNYMNSQVVGVNYGNITQLNSTDTEKLDSLVKSILDLSSSELTEEEQETVTESVNVISSQIKGGQVTKGLVRSLLNGIKVIKGSAEFGAAVAALIEFSAAFIAS